MVDVRGAAPGKKIKGKKRYLLVDTEGLPRMDRQSRRIVMAVC
jgi:hypothetical protein